MASIKVKFQPSAVAGHEGSIYFQIIHARKIKHISTSYRILPTEWNQCQSAITVKCRSERQIHVLYTAEHIRIDMERLKRIITRLENMGSDYSVDDIITEFTEFIHKYTLFNFMEHIISQLRSNGRIRTAETYRTTLNGLQRFIQESNRPAVDIILDHITHDTIEAFSAWLRQRNLSLNTISFYNRILRAVYNRAVQDGVITDLHPFRNVYTGIDKTVKRALPLSSIRTIKALQVTSQALDFARDMFMMSFYLRGMSFIDMAFLLKSDLRSGYITYRRRKTGQMLIIKWTKEMQALLCKYPANSSKYLMPIIRRTNINELSAYRNAAYRINKNLKRIAQMAGVNVPLSMYVARHSWASAAKSKGIPLSVISEGMGHDSETTTMIYLASLDTSVVDRANARIIAAL